MPVCKACAENVIHDMGKSPVITAKNSLSIASGQRFWRAAPAAASMFPMLEAISCL